jgi:hypothetical protein
MKSKLSSTMVVILWSVMLCLTACTGEWELSGRQRNGVLSFSEGITDNLLAGLAANDYQSFSRDFDEHLLKVLLDARFETWKADIDQKLGDCLSREVVRVIRSDEFYVVTYQVEFAKAPRVTVGVAFHAAKPHRISFISFDSKLFSMSSE